MVRDSFLLKLEGAERRDALRPVRTHQRRLPSLPPLLASLYGELGYWSATGLSSGSFADVYKARALSDGSFVALKCFRPQRADVLDVWKREVEALHCFPRHAKCITRMLASRLVANIYPVIILDLGGISLRKFLLNMNGACIPEKASIVEQIVKAVRFMHDEVQIVHRDIKLDNIVVDEVCVGNAAHATKRREIHLRLCDFGLAKKCDELGKLTTFCGSLVYMAPELLSTSSDGYSGQPVDVWALGVCVFEVCENGRSPWPRINTYADLARAIHRGTVSSMSPHIHPLYKTLVHNALTKDASRRPRARELRIPIYKAPSSRRQSHT